MSEANRLQGGELVPGDTARVLRMTRYMVGWASTGIQMGAFEATLKYAQERLQFGKPIASFQMVQDLLRQDARQRDRLPVPDGMAGANG